MYISGFKPSSVITVLQLSSIAKACMFLFRFAVSCIVTSTGVVYPFLKDFAYTKYSGRVQLTSVTAAHWNPNEGGWAIQVASNAGEWMDCLCLAIYASCVILQRVSDVLS